MNENITPHAFVSLGGKPRPVDKRDHQGSSVPVSSTHPAVFMQDKAFSAPIYYQGKRPACGAHASVWLTAFKLGLAKLSARFSWIDIKKTGADKNPSDGTDMRSIFNSSHNTGVDAFEPLENDVSLDDVTYADPSVITPPMLADASTKKIAGYSFKDAASFDELKQLIYDNGAVLLLLRVGASMWTAPNGTISWAEADVCPLRIPSHVVDGHFVVAHSFDEQYIYFANSWGTAWGRMGHGYFGADYMPYVLEVGTISVPVPQPVAHAADLSTGQPTVLAAPTPSTTVAQPPVVTPPAPSSTDALKTIISQEETIMKSTTDQTVKNTFFSQILSQLKMLFNPKW